MHIEKYIEGQTMQIKAVGYDFKPTWTGCGWKYNGKVYPSLRILKTKTTYNFERRLANVMSSEIRKEIDKDILDSLYGMLDSRT